MLIGTTNTNTREAQFASTPRGARHTRHLAVRWMEEWGHPPVSDASCAVALVVGELAANAVRHGRVPGRDFRIRLVHDEPSALVRVEVADAASGKRRPPVAPPVTCPDGESGRGLFLVDVLAVRWGWEPRRPVGKTVWAEVPCEKRCGERCDTDVPCEERHDADVPSGERRCDAEETDPSPAYNL